MAKKVLNVEDDADTRTFVSTVLEENGYTPIMAMDGEEGMKKIKKERPDLIILDILMPRESGIKMYHELKLDPNLKDIPVVMLTSRTAIKHRDKAKALGAKGFIVKPYNDDEFVRLIIELTGRGSR